MENDKAQIFAPVIENLAALINGDPAALPTSKPPYWAIMLDKTALSHYIAHTLTHNFDLSQTCELDFARDNPPRLFLSGSPYKYPLSEKFDGARLKNRESETYPLTAEELAFSKEQRPSASAQLDAALNALQGTLALYFKDLKTAALDAENIGPVKFEEARLPIPPYGNKTLDDLLSGLETEALRTNDFKSVLTPVIASSIASDAPLSGKDTQSGVKKLFDRSAFASVIRRTSNYGPMIYNPKTKHCPFGQIFGALWNAEIIETKTGQFEYTGRQKSGGFFDAFQAKMTRESLGPGENLTPQSQAPL